MGLVGSESNSRVELRKFTLRMKVREEESHDESDEPKARARLRRELHMLNQRNSSNVSIR
jgi:hypothetical protein